VKIMISYPPISKEKGWATLGQNRQFQYFHSPTYIYPVVPAIAATLLKENGFEIIWNDCIAENWSYDKFLNFLKAERPDLIAMETKTPTVKQHWKIIDDIKREMGEGKRETEDGKWEAKIILFGDHVTALPEESFQNSKVDFVLTGGDYDFLLLNLCKVLKKVKGKGDAGDEMRNLEPGIWYRQNGAVKNTGQFQLNHNLDSLPFVDRDLTKWPLYAYKNGNYKRTPGTYIMSGRDCFWGKCKFCSWTTLYPHFRVRPVENVLDEIDDIIENYPIKEIMDDTGSITPGGWLGDFCRGMIKRGYNRRIGLDCNMRFGAASLEDYRLMKKAGFRFLLFGLESANQNTLDRIDKNLTVKEIIESCKLARTAGLYPHITIMFGYPWESYEEALNTLKLGNWLLRKGFAYTLQATIIMAYPGTPLFEECKRKDLLNTLDWSRYDMKEPVMKLNFQPSQLAKLVRGIYSTAFNPEFLLRKILSIRDKEDIKYFFRAVKKVSGHILDFDGRNNN